MKLYLNDTSPFARLVLVSAFELGLPEMLLDWVDPWASPAMLTAINPFSTVPTLLPKNGSVILESLLICQYLAAHQAQPQFCNIDDFHRLSIGKSLMELSFRHVILQRFAPNPHSNQGHCELSARSQKAVIQALNQCAVLFTPPDEKGHPVLADLCFALALSYIRFRSPGLLENTNHHQLLHYLEVWEKTPSFRQTCPNTLKAKPKTLSALKTVIF